jgi:hypothetical protein
MYALGTTEALKIYIPYFCKNYKDEKYEAAIGKFYIVDHNRIVIQNYAWKAL